MICLRAGVIVDYFYCWHFPEYLDDDTLLNNLKTRHVTPQFHIILHGGFITDPHFDEEAASPKLDHIFHDASDFEKCIPLEGDNMSSDIVFS